MDTHEKLYRVQVKGTTFKITDDMHQNALSSIDAADEVLKELKDTDELIFIVTEESSIELIPKDKISNGFLDEYSDYQL